MRNNFDVELGLVDSNKSFCAKLKYDSSSSLPINNANNTSTNTNPYYSSGNHDQSPVSTMGMASIQVALLYTNASGQRLIRVFNSNFHISQLASTIFKSAELDTTMNLLWKQAINLSFNENLQTVREKLTEKAVKILSSYRKLCAQGTSPGQVCF